MSEGTPLLNDDGTASMATFFMSSHHGLRRDLRNFARALDRIQAGDRARATAVATQWKQFHEHLHGHHAVEDAHMFPGMAAGQPDLAGVFAELGAQHKRIDPLLAKGDAAFGTDVTDAAAAKAIVVELADLLATHLSTEERHVVPLIRAANEFPPPATEDEAKLYAAGFSWSLYGLHGDVCARVLERLPEALLRHLPDARQAFSTKYEAAFGPDAGPGSRTSVPA